MEEEAQLIGVWMSPAGPRVEVLQVGGRWRTLTYMSRRGGTPGAVHDFAEEAKLWEAVRGLEGNGFVRQVPGQAPPEAPKSQITGQVMIALGIGFAVLVVLVLLFA